MRKFTKSIMLLAAVAMAFVSCNKEEAKQEIKPVDGKIKVHFAAKTEELTKVSLTPEEDDTKFIAAWDELDVIDITSYIHGGSKLETVSGMWNADDECFETEFDPEFYEGEEVDFVGVWPVDVDADELIPAVRTQYGASYNGQYDIMKSKRTDPVTLEDDATIILDMIRYTSIAYFHITSDLNEPIVSATLTTGEGEYIASSNATIGVDGFETNVETAGVNSIKVNIDGEMSSSDFKLWFNVLPVRYTTMTLRVETANHSFSLSKKASGEWKVGELNKAVIKNVPADKWAEIERPAGESTETIAMTYSSVSGSTYTPKTSYETTDGIVTLTFARADANNDVAWNNNSSELRLYASGTLTITAGEYKIKEIVYDAVINGGGKDKDVYPTPTSDVGVLDAENSIWTGNENTVVITPVGTVGNMGFKSITVTYEDPNASSDPVYKYSVSIDKNVTDGTVSVDKASAKEGDEVTITATPADGYELVAESVKAFNAVSGAELIVTNNKFTMPAANVNVTAAFSLIPTLSATSPEPYASNLTNNSGAGFSIPVTANQAWVAVIKAEDPNAADITLMTAEGEGGENNNLVFKFNSQNTSPLTAKSTVVVLSPKSGNRPEPIEITITHEKRTASLVLNDDDKATITANVAATETSYTANITAANFSEWSVLEYKIGDVAQSTTDANCVTIHNDGANTGSVTIGFPANASESNEVVITLKVGYEGIITKTLTLTQAAAAVRTPNVTLDFTVASQWGLRSSATTDETTYSNDGYSIVLAGGGNGNGHKYSTDSSTKLDYLINGKSGATLTFPVFDFDVDKIKVYGHTGASTSVIQNIYVGETAVSTQTTGAAGTNTYEISSDYQSAGNVYVLKVTSAHNTQITKIEIFGGAPKTVTSVAVSGNPTKKSYDAGEVFNPAGLTVTANYDDGSSKTVTTGITWTDGNGNELVGLTAGTTSVTVKAVYKDIPSEAFTVYGLTVTAPTPKTDLDAPTGLTWTESTKTLSWNDPNTSKGTYNTNYKYQYSVNGGSSWSDATTSTTAVLSIASTTTVKVKAVAITTATHNSSSDVSKECIISSSEKEYSHTFTYGEVKQNSPTWSLTNKTDKTDYWLVPSGNDPSVATMTGLFSGKTITKDVVITINCATFGSGTNPGSSNFTIYKASAMASADKITATQGGTLPTSSTYTNVTYKVSVTEADKFVDDLIIKITKPGKQIRLKSIKVEFSYK